MKSSIQGNVYFFFFFWEVCSFSMKTLGCVFNRKFFQFNFFFKFAYVVLCSRFFFLVFLCWLEGGQCPWFDNLFFFVLWGKKKKKIIFFLLGSKFFFKFLFSHQWKISQEGSNIKWKPIFKHYPKKILLYSHE